MKLSRLGELGVLALYGAAVGGSVWVARPLWRLVIMVIVILCWTVVLRHSVSPMPRLMDNDSETPPRDGGGNRHG